MLHSRYAPHNHASEPQLRKWQPLLQRAFAAADAAAMRCVTVWHTQRNSGSNTPNPSQGAARVPQRTA